MSDIKDSNDQNDTQNEFKEGDYVRIKAKYAGGSWSKEFPKSAYELRRRKDGSLYVLSDRGIRAILERHSAPDPRAKYFEKCDAPPQDVREFKTTPKKQAKAHDTMNKVTEAKEEKVEPLPIDLDVEDYDFIGTRYPVKYKWA